MSSNFVESLSIARSPFLKPACRSSLTTVGHNGWRRTKLQRSGPEGEDGAESTKYELALSKLSAVMIFDRISGIILEGFYSIGL